MIPFKRLELARRQEVFDWFHQAGRLGCEYSFVNLYLWGASTCRFCGGLSGGVFPFYGHSMYLFPSGHGPLKPVLEALREDAREREIPFRLTSMSVADCRAVEELYPGQFKFYPDRDGFDYLYEIDHLADLKGKKYQQKRNHINRFLKAALIGGQSPSPRPGFPPAGTSWTGGTGSTWRPTPICSIIWSSWPWTGRSRTTRPWAWMGCCSWMGTSPLP